MIGPAPGFARPSFPVLAGAVAFACALALALAGARHAQAAEPAEWIPVGDPIYRELEMLRAAGLADTSFALFSRPLARKSAAAITARARRLHPDSREPSLVRLEREFAPELVRKGYPRPPRTARPLAEIVNYDEGAESMRLRLQAYAEGALLVSEEITEFEDRSRFGGRLNVETGGLLLHLDAYAGKVEDATSFADPLVEGSDFAAYSEDTYGSYSTRYVDATLGRSQFAWGPGATGSLLWSRTAAPVTFLSFSATLFRHVRATAIHADVDATRDARLAGHRLEWFPSPRLTVGIAEAARYTSSHWEPLYVFSLLPYTWVQRILAEDALDGTGTAESERNNVMGSLDVSWQAARGHVLYGEFLLDDQGLSKGDQPTRIGYQAGWLGTHPFRDGRVSARVEFSRVYNYVYSVFYGEDFIHHGKPIGYAVGPDSRSLVAEVWADPTPDWEFRAGGGQVERGEGRLGTFYDPDSTVNASGSTLSGTVERERFVTGGARFWPWAAIDVSLDLAYVWTDNRGNVAGADDREWRARVGVRLEK